MVVVSVVFRRLLVALALCAAAFAASLSSSSARSYHHHARQYAHVRHAVQYAGRYVHPRFVRETASAPGWDTTATSSWSMAGAAHEDMASATRWNRAAAALRHPRFAHVQASVTPGATQGAVAMTTTSSSFGGGSDLVSEARRYIGGNPTSRGSLWCARFMNFVLERTGHRGTGSDMASSFASFGHRVSGPQVGAIAVMGHHVGIITGLDAHGNPIMISGNNGNRVREAPISRGRIYAYVMPN